MPHSYDVTDVSTEKWIEFMEPEYNSDLRLSSIE